MPRTARPIAGGPSLTGTLALALALAPALAAEARCPVAADLASGIRFVYGDDTSEVYRAGAGGAVVVDGYTGDTLDRRLTLLHGVFLTRYAPIAPDGAEAAGVSLYDFPPDTPPPAPGTTWSGLPRLSEAGQSRDEPQTHVAGPLRSVEIAGCPYEAFDISVDFGELAGYSESLVFMPDLGIGYLAGYANDGGDPRAVDVVLLEALE